MNWIRKFFYLFLLLVSQTPGKAQKVLLPVRINYQWGYINEHGNVVIPTQYDRVGAFNNFGYATVHKNGIIKIIDSTGQTFSQPNFQQMDVLDKFVVKVSNDSLWGLQNLVDGKEITPRIYSNIEKLDNFYLVKAKDKQGIIDRLGRENVPLAYDSIQLTHTGFFILYLKNKLGAAPTERNIVATCRFLHFKAVDSSIVLLKDSIGWYGMDRNGKFIFENIRSEKSPENIESFIEFQNGKDKIIFSRSSGKIISLSKYDDYTIEDSRFIYLKSNGKIGIMDPFGSLLTDPIYTRVNFDSTISTFRINKKGKWGLLSINGKTLFSPSVDMIGDFTNSLALLQNKNRYGIIHKSGRIIYPCTADKVIIYKNKAEIYTDLERISLTLDNNGNITDEIRLKKVKTLLMNSRDVSLIDVSNKAFKDTLLQTVPNGWFEKNRKWGMRNSLGKVYIPNIIDAIEPYPALGLTRVAMFNTGNKNRISVTGFGVVDDLKMKFILRPGANAVFMEDFEKSLYARVAFNNRTYALLQRNGDLTTHMQFKLNGKVTSLPITFIGDFVEDKARIALGGNYVTFSEKGEFVSSQGRGFFIKGSYWGYVNREGILIYDPQFQFVQDYKNGKAIVKLNNRWGLADTSGTLIIPNKYTSIIRENSTGKDLFYLKSFQKKAGILSKEGKITIAPSFDEIGSFYFGYAKAKQDGKWGFINDKGDTLTSFKFQQANDFHEGLASVKYKNKFVYIDTTGKLIIPIAFEEARDFHGSLAAVVKKGKYGFIDKSGNFIIEPLFNKVSDFNGNHAAAKSKRKFGIIDMKGKWIIKPSFHKIDWCTNGYAIVKKKHYGIVDDRGKQILKCNFKNIQPFSEGLAEVQNKKGLSGYVDSSGKFVIPCQFKSTELFKEGLAVVLVKDKFGYIDKTGKIKIQPIFKKCSEFNEGRAYASTQAANGFIDSTGNFLVKLKPFNPLKYSEGKAVVPIDKNYYYVSTNGQKLFQKDFEYALPFQHGMGIIMRGGKYGVINSSGFEVIPPRYYKIEAFKGDYAQIFHTFFHGLADRDGKILIEPDFEIITYLPGPKLFRMQKGDLMGYLSEDGNWIWKPTK